jgi:hypothetical protein
MLRLCGESSRPYPGRPVQFASEKSAASCVVTRREIGQESAEVIVALFERRTEPKAGKVRS